MGFNASKDGLAFCLVFSIGNWSKCIRLRTVLDPVWFHVNPTPHIQPKILKREACDARRVAKADNASHQLNRARDCQVDLARLLGCSGLRGEGSAWLGTWIFV